MNKVQHFCFHTSALVCAALLALLGMGRAAPRAAHAAVIEPQPVQALLLAETTSSQDLLALADRLRQAGATPMSTFPNQGMLLMLDPLQAPNLRQLAGVRLLALESVPPAAAGTDPGAQTAVLIWNQLLAEQAAERQNSPLNSASLPPLPDDDMRFAPDLPGTDTTGDFPELAIPGEPSLPGLYQTSEFMIDSVNVDVFLVESDNSSASNNENWTAGAIADVQREITTGLNWWVTSATTGGQPGANLTFNINFHTPVNEPTVVSTSYEPIKLSTADDDMWINQVFSHLGYNYSYATSNARYYNHARRAAVGTDWAVTIFIANSIADSDGMFYGGGFGYAYVNGPFMVMTYDNDGWSINNMEIVTAHENSHLFGGLDEYSTSGCTTSEVGGYLGIANTNCENGTPTETSIMRSSSNQQMAYNSHLISTPVRGMVGWRDSDSDGIYDPVDTTPTITLNGSGSTTNLSGSTASLTGSTGSSAWSPSSRPAANINDIHAVSYRLNGGSWAACSADDGAFDEETEAYTCALSGLADGSYTVEVMATNRTGITSAAPYPSLTLMRDVTGPVGSISINNGASYTTLTSAVLALAATDSPSGVAQMRFCNDGLSWSGWESYAASKNWTLAAGEGSKTVSVQFKDGVGNLSSAYTDTIVLDTSAPSGTVSINSGAAYTGSSITTLTVSASDARSGVAQMRFSNDGISWSVWETYSTSKTWTIPGGEGSKTVYAQFKDGAGLSSANASDSIVLDGTAPTGTISINAAAAYTGSVSVTLTLTGSDAASGVAQARFSNDNATWGNWETFATSMNWIMAGGEGGKTVYMQLKDNAGNSSDSLSDSITLDLSAPLGSLQVNSADAYTISTAVTLALTASDSGAGVYQMRFSNDNSSWTSWVAFANSAAWNLDPTDGDKNVYAQISDHAGNISQFSAGILLDSTAPQVTIPMLLISSGGVVSGSWSAVETGSGQVVFDVQFRIGESGVWTDWLTGTPLTSASFGPEIPGSNDLLAQDSLVIVRVRAHDAAGNVSDYVEHNTAQASFTLFLPVAIR